MARVLFIVVLLASAGCSGKVEGGEDAPDGGADSGGAGDCTSARTMFAARGGGVGPQKRSSGLHKSCKAMLCSSRVPRTTRWSHSC